MASPAEICAITDTLILDEDDIYHPGDFNDRLLGLKGTMSEAELHLIRAIMRGDVLSKAKRGESLGRIMRRISAVCRRTRLVAVGYVRKAYGLRSRFDRLRERGLLTIREVAQACGVFHRNISE